MEKASKSGGAEAMAGLSAPTFERAPLAMVEVEGPDHRVCFVNLAFCHLVRKTREELVGKPFAELVCNGANCTPLLDQVYETGEAAVHAEPDNDEPAHWLYAMWPALGTDRRPAKVIVQLTKSAHFKKDAAAMNEALVIGALRQHELREAAEQSNALLQIEVAERKRAEKALQEAQAKLATHADSLERMVAERTAQLQASMGELEAFSYTLAHDLRAPIRAIHGFTQIVLEMPAELVDRSAVELLHRVMKAAARMDSLIQDVLNLSQIIRQPIVIEPVEVDALARELVAERPELSPPKAEIKIESPLLPMMGHEATLSQCLTNLLSNAVKFVEPGAVPQVRVWTEERVGPANDARASMGAAPHSSASEGGPTVRLWVEDRGIGISAGALDSIFDIFQRLHSSAKYEGTGIGLAIVRKAIERMGGRVGVTSEPGQGSRFWLELPRG